MSSLCQYIGRKYVQTTCRNILQQCLSMCHSTIQAASQKIYQCVWWFLFAFTSEYISEHVSNLNVHEFLDNVGMAIINHPLLMVYTTDLWWLGWFIIAIPTLQKSKTISKQARILTRISFLRCPDKEENPATPIPPFRSNTNHSVPKRPTRRFGIPLGIRLLVQQRLPVVCESNKQQSLERRRCTMEIS